ncbi:MAG: 16S rRNA (uracil(1498)-N(3))-methyltransferase [Alphaproteobacteria bacterium]|nr:16S rRNA (uracil(1498)-N(3))-methyltransferase [Alphaproteobacteria bacterium]
MTSPYPKIRLFVESSLLAGATFALKDGQAHYLMNVMRLNAQEPVAVFNGRDGEWSAMLRPVSKKKADLQVMERLKPQVSAPDIWLAFAPIKHGRIDFLAEKATELGVSALQPVMTARTIVSRVNTERLYANAIEAAEQCERMDVPLVQPPVKLNQLLSQWPQERVLIYGDETGHGSSPQGLFAQLPTQVRQWAVLVGPEGGFTPQELEQLHTASFAHGISLGPRILRADTAALTALSCVMAWRGDWNNKPRFEGA